jgi:hypothetical protein
MSKVPAKPVDTLLQHLQAVTTYGAQRREGLAAFKRETFETSLPMLVTVGADLVAVRKASDLPDSTELSAVLGALRTALASDEERAAVLKSGSDSASYACTIGAFHTPATLADYIKACGSHVIGTGDDAKLVPSEPPAISSYCQRLNFINGKGRETPGAVREIDPTTGRFTRKVVKAATPETTENVTPDSVTDAVLAAALKVPARFLPGEFTWAELKAISEWSVLAVKAHELKVTKSVLISDDKRVAVAAK